MPGTGLDHMSLGRCSTRNVVARLLVRHAAITLLASTLLVIKPSSTHSIIDRVSKLPERADARAVHLGIQIHRIEEQRVEPRCTGALDVDPVEVADVKRRLRARADALEGQLEQAWVGLLDALEMRVQHQVE